MRPRRPVPQPSIAFSIEAGDPTVGALPGDPHRFGRLGNRPSLLADPLHQQAAAMKRQTSVTVTHEDLRFVKTAISTALEVFVHVKPVTNLLAEYS
jgi:hypothetical protein